MINDILTTFSFTRLAEYQTKFGIFSTIFHQAFGKPDALDYAIRGILSQGMIRNDLPIAYTSRLLNKAEQNYSTREKELFAIVYSVQFFRLHIYNRKFTLVTDHQPLKRVYSVKDSTSRFVQWRK